MFGRSRWRRIDALGYKGKTAKLAAQLRRGTPADRQRAAENLLMVVRKQDRSRYRSEFEPKLRALVEPLIRTLGCSDSQYELRDVVATTLGHIGDPEAIPALAALLPDTSSAYLSRTVGAAAADALGRICGSAARGALVDALADERFPAPRLPLLIALVEESECGPDLAQALIAVLGDAASPGGPSLNVQTTGAVADILDRVGAAPLGRLLLDSVVGDRHLLMALARVDAQGLVDGLVRIVLVGDPIARRAAVNTLANLATLIDRQDRRAAMALTAVHEAVDPGAVLRTFLNEELRTFVDEEIRRAAVREHHFSPWDRQRLPWDDGEYPDLTAAITSGDWVQVVEFGVAAADPLSRMIFVGTDLPGIRQGSHFRSKSIEDAVAALERIVSAHGATVPRWVLQAGAMVSDFSVATHDTDFYKAPVAGYRVDASNLRAVCLETFFSPQ